MTPPDLFSPPPPGSNAPPEYSVSELSHKLKRLVEGEFGFVRVRGEISKVTLAKSGHLYTALKDADAVLEAVCWKGTLSRLSVRPEEGMEVVCTGRLTTYPGRSNYQMVIETMELAGAGALLKLLEERKKKLAAEGLFDPARKKKIPFLPRTIGVVTSPTGAVIRDILHRVADRCPCRVIVWPVLVQGAGAAAQVAAAIRGFNALPHDLRPDTLIVARGGGSIEDLMPFNEEAVARAAAESAIPLISAVGHETDTTLIDFAADLRAPTPTAAAEMAVPVRAELLAQTAEAGGRILAAARRTVLHQGAVVQGLSRGLGDPRRWIESAAQRLDHHGTKLDNGLTLWLERRRAQLREASARLSARPLLARLGEGTRVTAALAERLKNAAQSTLKERRRGFSATSALLDSLSFERVLERGYAVVFGADGRPLSSAQAGKTGENITLRLKDGTRGAVLKDPV